MKTRLIQKKMIVNLFSQHLILTLCALVVGLTGGMKAHAMPGDMLDQALHQSMREHTHAQKELAATGTTRFNNLETPPTVQTDGLRIVVGQGEILPDAFLPERGLPTEQWPKATHASNANLLGFAEPSRMDASASSSSSKRVSEDLSEAADQELADPAP